MSASGEAPAFVAFDSIPRLLRDVVITEKIDGTNAQVHVTESGDVLAGSRNRWLTVDADNFGFAAWVAEHADTLRQLGPGSHYGEWWGAGIQRRYNLDHKRFSLFNTGRWHSELNRDNGPSTVCEEVPCCHVVPVMGIRTLDTDYLRAVLDQLAGYGSIASPGFMKPEGIVVFHTKSNQLFKVTLDKNDGHKGAP